MSYSHANRSRRPSGRSYRHGRSGGNRRPRSSNKTKTMDYRLFIKDAKKVVHEAYVPKHTFADFGFSNQLSTNLAARSYKVPTPIQDQSIPFALKGNDVLGIANTGTGKTAAFLLPLIERVIANPRTETVLIIAPVRELAQQIEQELAGFTKNMRIGYMSAIGGAPIGPQIRKIERAPHFVIGTPGRITDLIERGVLPMHVFSAVVLDEVDRMLDMGFVDDVRAILEKIPASRQSLFFSATITPQIQTLIHGFMNDPVTISVKTHETSDNVQQDVVRIGYGMEKIEVLHDVLVRPEIEKALVFGKTKYGVERLAKELAKRGHKADAIHGNKSQGQRTRTIDSFKRGNCTILVATDVAARGLDIDGVSHVINYDLPQTYEDYTHRIGRTGRAGKTGTALTFIEG